MGKRKAKNQKRSTTSINIGQNIYSKSRKGKCSIDNYDVYLA